MRPRWRLLALLISLALVGVALALILPAMDAAGHGPYSTWYNRRCQRLADKARLVGRPEADVVKVLGPPAYTYLDTTYNYVPVSWFPTAKFQVHCKGGVVVGVEQFDD